MKFLPAALLPLLSSLGLAAKLTISIPPSNLLQNPSLLPSTTTATLHSHGVPQTAHLTRQSTFVFSNLTTGSYLLTVHCRDFSFEPLRVDVSPSESGANIEPVEKIEVWQTFRGNEWSNKGESRGAGVKEVEASVRVVGQKEYYQKREGFDVLSFLKSPMILMALFSMGMIFGIPWLMENMDPETYKEMQEMQKQSPLTGGGNPANAIQNFDMAGWLAGKSSSTPERSASPKPAAGQSKKR